MNRGDLTQLRADFNGTMLMTALDTPQDVGNPLMQQDLPALAFFFGLEYLLQPTAETLAYGLPEFLLCYDRQQIAGQLHQSLQALASLPTVGDVARFYLELQEALDIALDAIQRPP
jgi:hypothetical protein